MTTHRTASSLLLILGLAAACGEAPTQPGAEAIEAQFSAEQSNRPESTTNPVLLWDDPTQQMGTSTLTRTKNGVNFTLDTSGLIADDVVTLWMVVFNNPEYCDDGCDIPDFFNPLVQADALYADGRLIGPSGRARYAGRRNVGDVSGSIFPAWLSLPAYGILDAAKAEIHFVVHTHGQKIPGLVGEMLNSFNAGCAPTFMDIPVPEELGTHGPNTCQDVQFTMHLPIVH